MFDTRRLTTSRSGSLLGTFALSLFFSLCLCWLLGTPSESSLYVPNPSFPPGVPESGKVTVIIPSYHEAQSLKATISGLQKKLEGKWEIIVVDDDSQDGTDKVINNYRVVDGLDVTLITRTNASGLSSAVLDGMAAAKGDVLLVMDADGQHTPDAVWAMTWAMEKYPRAKMALGTRKNYEAGWPWYRRLISWGATTLARPLIGADATDPMTGLFAIRADVFRKAGPLNATGFKVALELLIKSVMIRDNWGGESPYEERVIEVPYTFASRRVGSSKLGGKVIIQYALQLFSLYYHTMGMLLPVTMSVLLTAELYILTAVYTCFIGRNRKYQKLRRGSRPDTFFSPNEEGSMELKEHSA